VGNLGGFPVKIAKPLLIDRRGLDEGAALNNDVVHSPGDVFFDASAIIYTYLWGSRDDWYLFVVIFVLRYQVS
jgi:hypothetical protein